MKKNLPAVLCCLIPLFLIAQRPLVEGWNENKINIFTGTGATSYAPCMIRIPDGYFLQANSTKYYPVIFSFHGVGEQGSDTVSVLNTGLCKNLSNHGVSTYTDESGTKQLGNDVPAANDKNG